MLELLRLDLRERRLNLREHDKSRLSNYQRRSRE